MKQADTNTIWINPIGGLGDILMLSGVLKQCHEQDPSRRFNLIRRAIYRPVLNGHPAIAQTGYPPEDAEVITTDYWSKEKLGKGSQRAYQILARMFGLETPIEEKLFLPAKEKPDPILTDLLGREDKTTIAIAPVSISPRKMMAPALWKLLVDKFSAEGIRVIQAGSDRDPYIPGAFSLLGLTDPAQLTSVLKNCNLLISVDNFVMHLARMVGLKAVVIWGPTDSETYGYPEHVHFQNPIIDCAMENSCLGAATPENYDKPCPLQDKHCMNNLDPEALYKTCTELIR